MLKGPDLVMPLAKSALTRTSSCALTAQLPYLRFAIKCSVQGDGLERRRCSENARRFDAAHLGVAREFHWYRQKEWRPYQWNSRATPRWAASNLRAFSLQRRRS